MRLYRPLFLLGVMVLAFVLLPRAYASPVTVSISPPNQAVLQTSLASYTIGLSTGAKNAYTLSLSGLVGGAPYHFSSNPVSTPGGSGSTTLTIDTSSTPLYCPGSYSFTVSASNSTSSPVPATPGDSGTSSATLTVVQVGPPLGVTLTTNKPTYRIGDIVTISLTANRPAEGLLTISSPSGAPSTFSYIFYGPSYTLTKTLTVNTIGRYTVNFQADDFCSGFSSASATFEVTPDTYDVNISLDGVPAQYSAQVSVDNQQQGTIGGAEIKKLTFKLDTTHTLTVDQYVKGDAGVQYFASQNTWTTSSAGSHTFKYETQYQFTVATDPVAITDVTGGGWYKAGTNVQTNQVPGIVPGTAGTQYAFQGWVVDGVARSGNGITLTMDMQHTAVATYQTQYQLLIDSPYGNPQGQGYYAAGSTATFSASTPWGFPVQQIFVRWEGDYTGTSPQGSLTMDTPKVIHAVWSTSYLPLIALIVAAAAVVGGLLFWRSRRRPAPETKPTPTPVEGGEAAENIKCDKCGTENSADQKFCTNCGEKLVHHGKQHTS